MGLCSGGLDGAAQILRQPKAKAEAGWDRGWAGLFQTLSRCSAFGLTYFIGFGAAWVTCEICAVALAAVDRLCA